MAMSKFLSHSVVLMALAGLLGVSSTATAAPRMAPMRARVAAPRMTPMSSTFQFQKTVSVSTTFSSSFPMARPMPFSPRIVPVAFTTPKMMQNNTNSVQRLNQAIINGQQRGQIFAVSSPFSHHMGFHSFGAHAMAGYNSVGGAGYGSSGGGYGGGGGGGGGYEGSPSYNSVTMAPYSAPASDSALDNVKAQLLLDASTSSSALDSLGLPHDGNHLSWPLGLRVLPPESQQIRQQIDTLLPRATLGKLNGQADEASLRQLTQAVGRMRQLLASKDSVLAKTTVDDARSFLRQLDEAVKGLQ
jgi:hypothetical protein